MTSNIDEFNIDELEAPEWMDVEFFTQVLRNCETNCTDLEVKNYKISPATAKGDHYASIMFRANVEYGIAAVQKHKSLIIKMMPEIEGHKKELLGESYIFETEIGMYTEVLPRFEQILREAGDDTVLKAPCLYHQLSPRKLIVFEDIVPLGYTVLRERGVTQEEVKCAYKKLAKWHAVSYKLNLEQPEFFDKYRHSLFNMPSLLQNPLMNDGIKNFIEMYKTEPRLREFVPYFEKMASDFLVKCRDIFVEYREAPQPDACYVLCHGDFHYKNMMFKHNATSGQLEDIMLHDFQFCYIGSIANDLIYSIFMMLDEQLREEWPKIVYSYFMDFRETLKKIGFEGAMPTLAWLHEQLKRNRHFELYLLVTFLPFWYAFQAKTIEPNELMTSSEKRLSFYKNEAYIAELQRVLPKYLHLGYFED